MMFIPLSILMIENESDRSFMEALYIDHYKTMLAIARKYVNSTQDAEDVVSRAIISLIEKVDLLKTFDEKTQRAYIFITVKRIAFSHLRRQKLEKSMEPDTVEALMPDDEETPEESLLRKSSVDDLRKAFRLLTENEQMLMHMKYFLDMTDEEIAEAEGILVNSVRPKLFRIRRKVEHLLREMDIHGESEV